MSYLRTFIAVAVASCAHGSSSTPSATSADPAPESRGTAASTAASPSAVTDSGTAGRAVGPTTRVYYGEAPDDGAAYVVAIGPAAPTADAFGGRCHIDQAKTGVRVVLPFKAMAAGASPPLTIEVGAADDKVEGLICSADGGCRTLSGGSVQLDEIVPNRAARGSYTLYPAGGGAPVSASFVATWCGSEVAGDAPALVAP